MSRLQVLLVLALGAGCRKYELYPGIFDLPIGAAVLQPEVGGPFQEPIGFVANGHGGSIVPLALKQGRVLTDDATVSFLRTNTLATGGARVLTGVAVTAPTLREVTLWAGDQRFPALLRIPYLLDCEADPVPAGCEGASPGVPVEPRAEVEVIETDSAAKLTDVSGKTGYTTTELWVLTFAAGRWTVEGSRSGVQPEHPVPGEPYSTEERRLNFTLQGEGAEGDVIRVATRTGIEEIEVGGPPLAVSASPDQRTLALIVHDVAEDRPFVRWFDTTTRALTEVELPEEAHPHRISWTEDGKILVADRALPMVWEIAEGDDLPIEHPMPWPTLDVAALDSIVDEDDPLDVQVRRLYVVPLDGGSVWLFDRDTDLPIDVNGAAPGDQGMEFHIPVMGIEALRLEYLMPEYTEDGIRVRGRSVAVSLADSTVVFAHEDTGCLVQDNLGPRTSASSGISGTLDYDNSSFSSTTPGPATLEVNASNTRHVVVNGCAGIATAEDWELRYDENEQGWRVSGSFSGEQAGLAREDERYVSDEGEVSFTVRAGTTPSRDGWTIRFSVDAGVASATGDNDGDGIREVAIGVGGDPVYFFYRVGLAGPVGDSEGNGWYPVDIRPLALVPGSSSDEVARLDPQRAALEVGWE